MATPIRKKQAERVLVIMVTAANRKDAARIGQEMVQMKLAACANIIPGIQSIYRWKGKVVKAQEVLLLLKTTKRRYHALQKAIKTMHAYEVPEIIALPVTEGLEAYVGWVRNEVQG